MHSHTINASLQIVPIVKDRHPYLWIDEAIAVIRQSGIRFEVGPFGTVLEGTYEEIMNLVGKVNESLLVSGCAEWISNLQLHIRAGSPVTAAEKTDKFR
jgi:uncharacterized protein YqgV (UPF0045/DUF77 family)